MPKLRNDLVKRLERIPGLEDRPSKVAGGSAIFYREKEIAHFHDDNEIDVRLTKKVIRKEGLHHPIGSKIHKQRSPSSEWMSLDFITPKMSKKSSGFLSWPWSSTDGFCSAGIQTDVQAWSQMMYQLSPSATEQEHRTHAVFRSKPTEKSRIWLGRIHQWMGFGSQHFVNFIIAFENMRPGFCSRDRVADLQRT